MNPTILIISYGAQFVNPWLFPSKWQNSTFHISSKYSIVLAKDNILLDYFRLVLEEIVKYRR